ncbi:MAG: glycosyltransferase family 2 protein, partial [Smithellaceae bacterium]|nr:glycosyltransferase family 2 protein [Smithellaceae bacterium]
TFRARDYLTKNKDKGYKIMMLPYYVGWTEGPSSIGSLISQRERWQRVTNETIWRYKYMMLNPKYGSFAFMTFPYFLFYEVLGVFFEISSIVFVAAGWMLGVLNVTTFLAFLLLMILSQAFMSLISIFSFVRIQRLFRMRYIIYLIFLSVVEFLAYRWIISAAKLLGTYKYLRKVREFSQYKRKRSSDK